MTEVRLGLCGFTIGAAQYYRRFSVLEVQQTFYDPPADETLRRWRTAAPPEFEFTMKAWQVISHLGTSRTYRRLKSPFSDVERSEAGGFRLDAPVLRTRRSALRCPVPLGAARQVARRDHSRPLPRLPADPRRRPIRPADAHAGARVLAPARERFALRGL